MARQPEITDEIPPEVETFFRRKTVRKVTGLSDATIYRKMASGDFPRSYTISEGIVIWKASEIRAWQKKVLEEAMQ